MLLLVLGADSATASSGLLLLLLTRGVDVGGSTAVLWAVGLATMHRVEYSTAQQQLTNQLTPKASPPARASRGEQPIFVNKTNCNGFFCSRMDVAVPGAGVANAAEKRIGRHLRRSCNHIFS